MIKQFDQFFRDPAKVREALLGLAYEGAVNPGDGMLYPGIASLPVAVEAQIVEQVGARPSVAFARRSTRQDKAPNGVHEDSSMGKRTLVVYVTAPEHCQGGTSFLRHKAGSQRASRLQADTHRPEAWQVTEQVPMAFNRGILFPSSLFHRAEPPGGFGESVHDARLVVVAFFKE